MKSLLKQQDSLTFVSMICGIPSPPTPCLDRMDIKMLSTILGHVSCATTLNTTPYHR